MKFTTIVVITADQPVLNNVRIKLPKESKAYLSKNIINIAALLPNIDMSNNEAVAVALSGLIGAAIKFDENGFYAFDTIFKDSLIEQSKKKIEKPLEDLKIFDYYDIFDLQMTDDLLTMVDGYNRFPDAIITPDLRLIRAPKAFMYIDESNSDYQEFLEWKNNFKKILEKYSSNSFSLILSCHI